jgi:glycogen(starch) synthase
MPGNARKDITVLEVSYEVCNKYGGIYTVITSKISRMMENIRNYIAVGPYYEKQASLEFEQQKPPLKFQKAFNALHKRHGINCYYGQWLIKGQRLLRERPLTILIDPAGYRSSINKVKKELWDFARVDSLTTSWFYEEPLPWSRATGFLIEELIRSEAIKGRAVAHFHEWLTGAGLLYLKARKVPVETVFTTHATMLGRAIAGTGREDIYSMINSGLSKKETVPDDKAREYQLMDKHSMEQASARHADVFTTVSDIVGRECEYILGRKPDLILPNGLDMSKFHAMEALSDLHITYRDQIRKFVTAFFSPYSPMDSKETILCFISGRFEFRNKGIDLFLDALGRLNKRLKQSKSKKTMIAFVWVPCHVRGRHPEIMENLALFGDLEEAVERESRRIGERIMDAFNQRKPLRHARIVDESFVHELRKTEHHLMKKGQAHTSPFEVDPNEITQGLERNGLLNSPMDKVKVIYYPTYLSSTDGVLGLNYYNAIMGCHVGVFPSYYEPWGYTPLETAALGCQSITTDLAGYGRFIRPRVGSDDYGIMVIPREGRSYEEGVACLENMLFRIYTMTKRQRGQFKIRAKQLSTLADWKGLIKNYLKAYDMALAR